VNGFLPSGFLQWGRGISVAPFLPMCVVLRYII
jgi:hypothetical protein